MAQRAMWRTTARLTAMIVATVVAMMATGLGVAGQTPADVAGDWVLTGETDGGPFTSNVVLEQNGTELTGRYSSDAVGEAELKGSVSGNDFMWSLSADLGGK